MFILHNLYYLNKRCHLKIKDDDFIDGTCQNTQSTHKHVTDTLGSLALLDRLFLLISFLI